MVCFYLNERAGMLFVRGMLSLRLTCSSINDKTYQLFGKTAFWARGIRWSSKSLQRFLEVSERAAFAEKVEALYFHASDTGLKREAEQAAADAANQELSRKQRRQAKSQLWRAKRDQDDKAYLVRSGMDGTLLATALARMPNVRRIMFDCLTVSESQGLLDRRHETARDESTTRTFAVVVSSFAHGSIKPILLKAVRNGAWVNQDEGVSLLQDFDITGSLSFADVLDALAESHNHLRRFSFSQIAQKSFRLYLEQLGEIQEHEMHRNYRADGTQDPEDFTNDYIVVGHHAKYLGAAEDWEGVQGKIRELRMDLRVSDLDYTTEDEISRLYLWIH
ncbi:hypothetical protein LTR17_003169 [Elasticomyces elasticus]|nr:hypothetical protein LTR17_003169 [Elasticomyces elasticus]